MEVIRQTEDMVIEDEVKIVVVVNIGGRSGWRKRKG